MPLITDPDSLNQGASTAETVTFGTPSGQQVQLTGTGLPSLAVDEYFEIRDAVDSGNNGLWQCDTVTSINADYTCTKVDGVAPAAETSDAVTWLGSSGTSTEKSVHIDTAGKRLYLLEQGNLSSDGLTMLALHSFLKEEWKDDSTLPMHPFPMIGIDFDAGKWEFGTDPSGNFSGFRLAFNDEDSSGTYSRQLIRNAGWIEYDVNGVETYKYFNVTTLGSFAEATDQAYYAFGNDPTDTGAAVNFTYADEVNEPVMFYEEIGDLSGDTPAYGSTSTITRTTGSFITDGFVVGGQVTVADSTSNDGTYVLTAVTTTTLTVTGTPLTVEAWGSSRIAVDNSNAFSCFLREGFGGTYGKTFAQANLTSAGETSIVNKVIKFPLANANDLDITHNDAALSGSPYDGIVIKYFDQAFNKEVQSGVFSNFGIVIDVDCHSGVDGSYSAAGTVLTTAEGGMGVNDYQGGTLQIWDTDADAGDREQSFTIASNDATTITISGDTFDATDSNISFTAFKATPTTADKNEIYEKVQYLLRQAADIDDTDQVVNGKTADGLLGFVGPDLNCGAGTPTNPNGGGAGVLVVGFDSNDTNNIYFYDTGGTKRSYPFVAAGSLGFNANLVNDSDPYYWLFYEYTKRTAATNCDMASVSGDTGDIQDSVGTTLPDLTVGDYINVSGFTNPENNGIYEVTAENTPSKDYTVRKLDGQTLIAEVGASLNVDEHPFGSPGAIIVDNNAGADIAGAVGSASIAFDYDYDGNTQGGRGATDDMYVRLVAIGLETGQYVISASESFQITRSTGLSFSVTSALERNYDT